MENSMTETEKLGVYTSKEDSRRGEEREKLEDKRDRVVNGGEVEESSGFIDQLISNFVPGEKEVETGEEKEEEKEGGLFSHIISNLVSSPRVREADEGKAGVEFESSKEDGDDDLSGGGGGGIINNLISNIFHHSEGGGQEEEKQKHHEEGKTADEDGGGGGGGGIIENIVSNFPTPLADDAAPASDEVSILIHSIIHD